MYVCELVAENLACALFGWMIIVTGVTTMEPLYLTRMIMAQLPEPVLSQ